MSCFAKVERLSFAISFFLTFLSPMPTIDFFVNFNKFFGFARKSIGTDTQQNVC